jgi:hypothetical protein
MNPWGTMNDWLRFEAEERVRHYGLVRRAERPSRRKSAAVRTDQASEPRTVPALSRDDLTACA